MYIERDAKALFGKVSSVYNAVAVVGARQSGKTTFLKEQMKQKKAAYVLFDDPDARNLFESDIKKFDNQYMKGHEITVLDEVQYCKDAGKKIKYLVDTGKKVWLTSSSEIILGKEILAHLVGRVSIIRMNPFSLNEFLNAKNQKELMPAILERMVWEHAAFGGYPKVVTTEDIELKKTILKDIYETLLLKDVMQTFSIDDMRTLEEFAKYLAINIGTQLSYENASKNLNISFQTAKKYLDAMEKSYLITRIPPFFTNKNKEITKQPKTYFIDTGLRNHITKSFNQELDGKLFENYVLSELIKAGFSPKYWRTKTKAEVDFIIEKDNDAIPIEVKLKAEPPKIERSLRAFIEKYSPKTALIVSYKTTTGETKINKTKIIFINPNKIKQTITNA